MTLIVSGSDFPRGGGQLGALIRDFDWSDTDYGPIEDWRDHLRAAVHIVLHSPTPLALHWGSRGHLIYNDAYGMLVGQRHPSILGQPVSDGWPEIAAFSAHVLSQGLAGKHMSYRDQRLALEREGLPEIGWFDLHYWPVLDDRAQPAGVLAAIQETTERVRAEQQRIAAETQQKLLIHELAHRMKNTLAIAQAITSQVLRTVERIDEVRDALGERLQALSDAQDLLTDNNWSSAKLSRVIETALAGWRPADPGRIRVSGPDISLHAKQVLAVFLAAHELGSNAAKFGAWSESEGVVYIAWDVGGPPDAQRITMTWVEAGGPLVQPPTRRGFGTRMIERMLAGYFEGHAAIRFETGGVAFALNAPFRKSRPN